MNHTGCCCSAAQSCNYPSIPSLHLTDGLPNDTAAAAGCSPKAALAAGNVPRHTVYSRAQGAGAGASQTKAARRSGPCVIICWGSTKRKPFVTDFGTQRYPGWCIFRQQLISIRYNQYRREVLWPKIMFMKTLCIRILALALQNGQK